MLFNLFLSVVFSSKNILPTNASFTFSSYLI